MKEPTMISKMRCGRYGKTMAGMGVLLFALILMASPAPAVVLETGNPDLKSRLDNTITYGAVARILDQSGTLLANPMQDDAERNFDKGLVMNRFDLLSEFDMVYKRKFGVRVSGIAWYDFVYNTENDNDSPGTVNHTSAAYNEFTDDVEKWHGRGAELMDALTWGAFDLGDMTFRYRAGQFFQMWGKSFFGDFGNNGIAGSLGSVNVAKAATVPNAVFKEIALPVPQVSMGLQVTDELELRGLYQFKWEPNRLFAAGSYYSPVDIVGPLGSERILADPEHGVYFTRTNDVEARDDGQFGLQLTYVSPWDMELALYAIRAHARGFYIVTGLDLATPPGAPPEVMVPFPSYYYYLYPEDIEYYGASLDTNVGVYPLSVEVTYRRNGPLASKDITLMPGQTLDNDGDPLYPVGETLHLDLTSFSPSNAGRLFCDKYDVIIELGIDHLLSVDKNEDMVPEGLKDTAVLAQVAYEPYWYQVFPGWELSMPMGISYAFEGRAAGMQSGNFGVHHGGTFNIGLKALYNNVWQMGVTYTNFYGDTEYQPTNQRDTLAFYMTRTF